MKAIPDDRLVRGVILVGIFGVSQPYKVLEFFDILGNFSSIITHVYFSDNVLAETTMRLDLLPGSSTIIDTGEFERFLRDPDDLDGLVLFDLDAEKESINQIESALTGEIPGIVITVSDEIDSSLDVLPVVRFSEGWNFIFDAIRKFCYPDNIWRNKRVLITAGRTEEKIDPIRIITNHSSGKMGFALARQAALRGAKVWLVAGPNHLQTPFGVQQIDVKTAEEMLHAAAEHFQQTDIVFATAAVEDLKPEQVSAQKIKKGSRYTIECSNAADVLQSLAAKKTDHQLLIGFSVETEHEIEHSRAKLEKKSLDAIVVNNPGERGAGFEHDTNKVTILTKTGVEKKYPLMSKMDLASELLDFTADTFPENFRMSRN